MSTAYWVDPSTVETGDPFTVSMWNQYVRDNTTVIKNTVKPIKKWSLTTSVVSVSSGTPYGLIVDGTNSYISLLAGYTYRLTFSVPLCTTVAIFLSGDYTVGNTSYSLGLLEIGSQFGGCWNGERIFTPTVDALHRFYLYVGVQQGQTSGSVGTKVNTGFGSATALSTYGGMHSGDGMRLYGPIAAGSG